jgi:hypothetical protein
VTRITEARRSPGRGLHRAGQVTRFDVADHHDANPAVSRAAHRIQQPPHDYRRESEEELDDEGTATVLKVDSDPEAVYEAANA